MIVEEVMLHWLQLVTLQVGVHILLFELSINPDQHTLHTFDVRQYEQPVILQIIFEVNVHC